MAKKKREKGEKKMNKVKRKEEKKMNKEEDKKRKKDEKEKNKMDKKERRIKKKEEKRMRKVKGKQDKMDGKIKRKQDKMDGKIKRKQDKMDGKVERKGWKERRLNEKEKKKMEKIEKKIKEREEKKMKKKEGREKMEKEIYNRKGISRRELMRSATLSLLVAIIIGGIVYFVGKNFISALIVTLAISVLFEIYLVFRLKFRRQAEISKMEVVFPDFIELMASNLRAGMTIDKALLLSSRKEFSPLDKEIVILGKDIVTGREIKMALSSMSKRINSEKISKTIKIIISGIKSGGNLAVLLEQTATNMREKIHLEKKAASSVLMYLIFISFAVAIGSPILFSLSTVLVEVLTSILGGLPPIEASGSVPLPLNLSSISISLNFIFYFSLVFMLVINFLASLLLGLVSRGEERAGMRYLLPLLAVSTSVFFLIRLLLLNYFSAFVS